MLLSSLSSHGKLLPPRCEPDSQRILFQVLIATYIYSVADVLVSNSICALSLPGLPNMGSQRELAQGTEQLYFSSVCRIIRVFLCWRRSLWYAFLALVPWAVAILVKERSKCLDKSITSILMWSHPCQVC